MMSIPCPCCGLRNQDEFRWGGQAHVARPGCPADVSDSDWARYLHIRKNIRGVEFERWQHLYGCGLWFHLARDTRTHQIQFVYAIDDLPPPALSPKAP